MSYYDDLGVPSRATPEQIEKTYRVLASKDHPDKLSGKKEQATAFFKRIQHAYDILANPKIRAAYDESLRFLEGHDEDEGQGHLLEVLLDYSDTERPVWQEVITALSHLNKVKREKLEGIQKALIELGPTLVEEEMLSP